MTRFIGHRIFKDNFYGTRVIGFLVVFFSKDDYPLLRCDEGSKIRDGFYTKTGQNTLTQIREISPFY